MQSPFASVFLRAAWLMAIIAGMVAPAGAEPATELARVIRVVGEGKATATPDMATIRTGVVTQAATSKEALDQNNAAVEKIFAANRTRGIAEKDVQTSDFGINPIFKQGEEGRAEPKIAGYRAQNEVRIHVRDLASLGEVLDSLVQAGSNQISGVTFGIDDPTGILNQARSQAVRDAKSRAEVYAQAAGVTVGPVVQISEQPIEMPRPMQLGVQLRAAAASVPIATGEHEYRVTINVIYELKPIAAAENGR